MIETNVIDEKSTMSEVADWICNQATWTTFLTLTFRDIDTTPEHGEKAFRWLVRVLNKELFGKRYTRIVDHSYFSYFIAQEYQRRGAIHYHVLIDRPVNYKMIHKFWGRYFGYAQTQVIRDVYSTAIYAVKYCLKENDYRLYKAKAYYKPDKLPEWWISKR